jgi:hypothetical protein
MKLHKEGADSPLSPHPPASYYLVMNLLLLRFI